MGRSRDSSITIRDVARVAGVSRGAVSKVINDAYGVSPEMKAKVQAVIDELGYRPKVLARGMRGSTYTLGVSMRSMDNLFFPKVINGACQALDNSRYQLIVAPAGPSWDEVDAVQVLADRQVDGIVAITATVPPERLEDLGSRIPLVVIGRHDDSANYDTIVGDDVAGARIAVQHLFDLGHRRIVHLTQPPGRPDTGPTTPHGMRVQGYLEAMAELGLADHAIVLRDCQTQRQTRDVVIDYLSREPGPVGFFAAHDELALGVLEARGELQLAPAQASVVGYDDVEIGAHPLMSLTSINQSGTRMGATAIQLLMERIEGRAEPKHEVMTPVLMERGSTASPVPPPT
mgnify:CR=1 FL=1